MYYHTIVGRIVCPYFRGYARQNTTCEWITKGLTVSVRFPSEKARFAYQESVCACMDAYPRCAVARVLNRHYENLLGSPKPPLGKKVRGREEEQGE